MSGLGMQSTQLRMGEGAGAGAGAGPGLAPASSGAPGLGIEALYNNPMFAGGLGLAGIGAAAAVARRGVIRGAQLLRKNLLVNVEISRRDPSYPWVLAWLSQPRPAHGFLMSKLTRIRDLSVATATESSRTDPLGASDDATRASFFLQPGYGRHIIRHSDGTYIAVNREKQSTANHQTGEPHETVTLTTLWSHRHVFEHVFSEAHALAKSAQAGKTPVYNIQGMSWAQLGLPRRKRPLASVVFEKGLKEAIVEDVQDFLSRHQWYADRGIPYRRTYLLHGPPGSGKSSFIHALAGELDYNLAIVNLVERGLTDDKLANMLMRLPPRSILLLEDVDVAFGNRQEMSPDGYSGATVTYSGLLNVLDGMAAGEDRIAFLTTNYVERLDPALIRPGRVDVKVRVGEATPEQAAELWSRFYGDVDTSGSGRERFIAKLYKLGFFAEPAEGRMTLRVSAAAIQGLFLTNKEDMEGAISHMEAHLIPGHSHHGSELHRTTAQ
ncbi:hypothetical protein MCOR27_001748 [Pyricularia oryzae]|uniref:Mitochondrial chaperone BCS1 n=2 Tax=Pyricularia TaxID=48558 RepID=A0ABQ8NNZ6_PYRGI|nr:hypothetical protein MCOR01_011272 [Pyricularia oryzae]KAI6299973.1 hypothetical protein MCOR33_004256 [Pyricularia grisea]KAH9437638.1 hypothetical protein MCOR02_001294 [Pyricularia oryzae]KAI6256249.1 hypothetical protein MCOR19_007284 [Pyricularia oryzae]KAI6275351.1 hypothetical protein MCOR26_006079 [Pyricularia oryzae]